MALAVISILVLMVLKSQEVLEQYRQGEFLNRVRTLEANLKAYRTTYGRWPGDCNRDGLIDYEFVGVSMLEAVETFDYALPSTLTAAANSEAAYAPGNTCPTSTMAPWRKVNVPYNELKLGGQLSAGETNRKAASHGLGGSAFLGAFPINPALTNSESLFNAIVLTRVSISSARRLAVAIDGSDGSASNRNRVRRANDTLTSFSLVWTAAGETENKTITVAIFFDRIPPVPATAPSP